MSLPACLESSHLAPRVSVDEKTGEVNQVSANLGPVASDPTWAKSLVKVSSAWPGNLCRLVGPCARPCAGLALVPSPQMREPGCRELNSLPQISQPVA